MTPLHSINRPYVALELICFSDQRIRQGKERCFGCMKRTAFSISLCVVTVLFGSQFLSAATEEKKQWPQYVSKDGGFEFAAAGEVKESSPARGIRQVRAVVDMGGDGSYQAIAGFFPVSLGSRDDAEKEFFEGELLFGLRSRDAGGYTGAELVEPSCGACIKAGPGSSDSPDQVTVSSQNRNFPGWSGPGKVYLASPLVVAASAIVGRIARPEDV